MNSLETLPNTLRTPSQIDRPCRALSDDELDDVAAGVSQNYTMFFEMGRGFL